MEFRQYIKILRKYLWMILLVCLIAPDLDSRQQSDPVYTAFAISFPASRSGKVATYTVNNVYSDDYGADHESEA